MNAPGGRPRHRSWPRISVRWDAWCAVDGAAPELCTACDLSAQGAFLVPRAGQRLTAGTRLSVRLQSPDRRLDLTTHATVRWVGASMAHGEEGFGIEFNDIVEAIDGYIRGQS